MGQTCMELFFCAVECGRYCLCLQLLAVRRKANAEYDHAMRRDHALRTADRLAHVDSGGSARLSGAAYGGCCSWRTAEPGDNPEGPFRVGPYDSRWIWTN